MSYRVYFRDDTVFFVVGAGSPLEFQTREEAERVAAERTVQYPNHEHWAGAHPFQMEDVPQHLRTVD